LKRHPTPDDGYCAAGEIRDEILPSLLEDLGMRLRNHHSHTDSPFRPLCGHDERRDPLHQSCARIVDVTHQVGTGAIVPRPASVDGMKRGPYFPKRNRPPGRVDRESGASRAHRLNGRATSLWVPDNGLSGRCSKSSKSQAVQLSHPVISSEHHPDFSWKGIFAPAGGHLSLESAKSLGPTVHDLAEGDAPSLIQGGFCAVRSSSWDTSGIWSPISLREN